MPAGCDTFRRMKVWFVALVFLIPLALSALAFDRAMNAPYAVDVEIDPTEQSEEPPAEPPVVPIQLVTWFAIAVCWIAVLIVEVRMNEQVKHLHGVIDKLERYVNTRDNILALRVDELSAAASDDVDDGGPRQRDHLGTRDWHSQRRHQ
jgi:hypothetical protein